MFRPYSLFVGHRYTRVKRKNHFISFISLTSMIGITLGVMVLITVISVMNGFSREIRKEMLSVAPHINLQTFDGVFTKWEGVLEEVKAHPRVTGATPFIAGQGMFVNQGVVHGVRLLGVLPNKINNVYPIESKMLDGDSMQELVAGDFKVVLGKKLARDLGIIVGDKVTLIIPEATMLPTGITPRVKRLTVSGIFDSGTTYDGSFGFINMHDAAKLYRNIQGITGIQIKVNDELYANKVVEELRESLEFAYYITDWTQQFAGFFDAIKMEKTVMWCILLLIIVVAAFNLVSTLVMMVTDKHSDIAILRTMGASRRGIMKIFVFQGAIIGVIGTLLGLAFGLLLAYNVTDLVDFIQKLFNVEFISKDVYFVGYVPSEIRSMDVTVICLSSLFMSFIATIYPAFKAASIQPAEALRYE